MFMAPNPVRGYSISKSSKYKKDCKKQQRLQNQILNKELTIVGLEEYEYVYHGKLSNACKGLLHARVDKNFRIIYSADDEHRIIFLKRMILHTLMDKKCKKDGLD